MHRNITEALRMHSPLVLLLRYAKTDFRVTTRKGIEYIIPKVWYCAPGPCLQSGNWLAGVTHIQLHFAPFADSSHICSLYPQSVI